MFGISRDRIAPLLLAISLHLILLLVLIFATDFFDLFREKEPPQIVHAVMVDELPESVTDRRQRVEAERQRREEQQRAEEARTKAAEVEQQRIAAEAAQKKLEAETQRKKEETEKRNAEEAAKQRLAEQKAILQQRIKELNCERVVKDRIKATDGQHEELKKHIDDCWAKEEKRLAHAEMEKKKEEEQKRKAEEALRKAEEARVQAELDAKRKAAEEEAKRKKAEEDKLKAEAERKRKEEEARLRAERARIEQQRQDELIAESAALERASAERERRELESELGGAASTWAARIQSIVKRNWSRPPGSRDDFECNVWVKIDNQGVVKDVRVTRSSGDPVVDRSVQSAVLKSSPLPLPEDLRVLDMVGNSIDFVFKPR